MVSSRCVATRLRTFCPPPPPLQGGNVGAVHHSGMDGWEMAAHVGEGLPVRMRLARNARELDKPSSQELIASTCIKRDHPKTALALAPTLIVDKEQPQG